MPLYAYAHKFTLVSHQLCVWLGTQTLTLSIATSNFALSIRQWGSARFSFKLHAIENGKEPVFSQTYAQPFSKRIVYTSCLNIPHYLESLYMDPCMRWEQVCYCTRAAFKEELLPLQPHFLYADLCTIDFQSPGSIIRCRLLSFLPWKTNEPYLFGVPGKIFCFASITWTFWFGLEVDV